MWLDTIIQVDNSVDLDDFIRSKMQRTSDGQWQCCFCGKMSRIKTNIFEHIESIHVESPGYYCDICNKPYRNRNTLRNHKYNAHKNFELK